MLIRPRIGDMPIRYRILVVCLAVFIPFALITGGLVYSMMRRALEEHIESELKNTSETVRAMVETSVRLSIRNYLRAVAESNLSIVKEIYGKHLRGDFTEAEAKRRAAEVIISQKIGLSGYLYCVTSDGTAVAHPDPKVQGRNFADVWFIKEQVKRKEGYIEYEWRNPDEKESRPKALSMAWFTPWDWIISATAYQSEFGKLVNTEDFKGNVEALKFGRSGYSFIVDLEGNLIIHPIYQGQNGFEVGEGDKEFLREIIRTREGRIVYSWRNPGEPTAREKLVVYHYVPEVHWIVASSAYLDDLYAPLVRLRDNSVLMGLFFVAIGIFLSLKVSASITGPVSALAKRLSPDEGGDLPGDEIERLSSLFNLYMEKLELEKKERLIAENHLRSSEERYRALMAAAPDPIIVIDTTGRVVYANLAFKRIFKWEPGDFHAGKRISFIPAGEREKIANDLERLLRGESVSGHESTRFTKDGEERFVSMSGGPYRDAAGNIEGCIVIFRDITEYKRLEREVINADEHERIRIGQDLHDDLAPHLIGIEVMCQVMRRKLASGSAGAATDAEKIQSLVTEAINKTRALARGLTPVHLTEAGLEMGLTQLLLNVEIIFGVKCRLSWEGETRLDATTAVHLYRIVQEALHNAIKHANAENIDLYCTASGQSLEISVRDDGGGIREKGERTGMGLKIMEFRARIIGAELSIMSSPDKGTSVTVTVKGSGFANAEFPQRPGLEAFQEHRQ